jgi:hypothetical protein
VLLSQLVEHIGGVHAGVISELSWDDLECLCETINNELGFALNGAEVFSKVARKLHLNGTTTSND